MSGATDSDRAVSGATTSVTSAIRLVSARVVLTAGSPQTGRHQDRPRVIVSTVFS